MSKSGAICGGIIKKSEWDRAVKEGRFMGLMMCYILPDDKYDIYFKLKREGKDKEASEVFRKYAWGVI